MIRLLYFIPVLLFLLLAVYFGVGLTLDPQKLPSPLIGKPMPEFNLPPIEGVEKGVSSAGLKGEVALLNVFASWCAPCLVEHPLFMKLKAEDAVPIYGVNWKD